MTQPDAKVAEQLWLRAHEAIKRGNLPQAVRDLAKSFEILKAVNDPRVRQVHAKWVAVHKSYLEEKSAGGGQPSQAAAVDYKTLQAQAESAANAGQLPQAIALYEKVLAGQPQNELASERLTELRQAQARANELSGRTAAAPVAAQPVAAQPVAAQPVAAQPVAAQPVAAQPVAAQPVAAQPVTAQPVAVQPVAAQPVAAQPVAAQPVAAQPVALGGAAPAVTGVAGQVAFLEGLLTRIDERRRPVG